MVGLIVGFFYGDFGVVEEYIRKCFGSKGENVV